MKDVRIVMHKSGQPKGVAYVEFETESDANVTLLSNQELKLRGKFSLTQSQYRIAILYVIKFIFRTNIGCLLI